MCMTGRNSALLLLCLLLFCPFAHAQLLVGISPKGGAGRAMQLYPDEIWGLELYAYNAGAVDLNNIAFKATAGDAIRIIDGGAEKNAALLRLPSLKAGEKQIIPITVKAVQYSQKNQLLFVNYGLLEFTNSAAALVKILESPLQIESKLNSASLDAKGEGSVLLSLKNTGQAELRNVSAALAVPPGIDAVGQPLLLGSLGAGQGTGNLGLKFKPAPDAEGGKTITLRVSFEDALGKHIIERGFPVEIQNRQWLAYLVVIALVALAVAALSLRKPAKKDGAGEAKNPAEKKK